MLNLVRMNQGKIKIRKISEKLEPEFNTNNNSFAEFDKHEEAIEIEDNSVCDEKDFDNSAKFDKNEEVIEIRDDSDEKDFDNEGIDNLNQKSTDEIITKSPLEDWAIMIWDAVHALDNKNGSSRKEIIKYVRAHFINKKVTINNYSKILKAMKLMIAGNTLISVVGEQHGAVGNGERFKSNIKHRSVAIAVIALILRKNN